MSESENPNQQDRTLQKAITSKIIDEYFDRTESWLRAILRMCIFSMSQLDGEPVLIIECPNQAVAKRLSRKTWPLQHAMEYLASCRYPANRRVLICYQDPAIASWRCFDTDTNTWKPWDNFHSPTAQADS